MTAEIEVENTGPRAGDEDVQHYIRALASRVSRPRLQLRDFRRVSLGMGDQKKVSFSIHGEDLAYYDAAQHAFRVEPGEYEVLVGSSSLNIHRTAKFHVAE